MNKNVLIILAEGFEELEAVTVIDLLRRADITVTIVSLDNSTQLNPVTASRGTKILPDISIDTALTQSFDLLVLPGGLPGADNLNKDKRVHQIIEKMNKEGKYISAICAAPRVLMEANLLSNKTYTCYPDSVDLKKYKKVQTKGSLRIDKNVTLCNNVVTSKGPGTAIEFALTLISLLTDKLTANNIADGLLHPRLF
ncbi:MAG: DJ-1/PfpI family protein [Gammaproteobacteria bacterium]|nr:DJ-1/PfpI family protein [Gammaproteobacteria bacterium]